MSSFKMESIVSRPDDGDITEEHMTDFAVALAAFVESQGFEIFSIFGPVDDDSFNKKGFLIPIK